MTYEEKAEQLLNSLPPEPEESNCECNEDYSWVEMELGEFKDGHSSLCKYYKEMKVRYV